MHKSGRGGSLSLNKNGDAPKHKPAPGTMRRTMRLMKPYAGAMIVFLMVVMMDSSVGLVLPLIFRRLINHGILQGNVHVVIMLALAAAGVSILDSGLTFCQRYFAVRIGLQMVCDLRVQVFEHIHAMPQAFFSRARTGALVARINSDAGGVQNAFTGLLSTAVGNLMTVTLVLVAMFALSWRLTVAALLAGPVFLLSARMVGKKLRELTRETANRTAEMNNLMVERFNVAGAMVCKIFGRPEEEVAAFNHQANRVREIGMSAATYQRLLNIGMGLIAALTTVIFFGWGGVQAARGTLDVGTLVALVTYSTRLYAPLMGLSSLPVDVMTTLVSFERVFEVLDLKPSIVEAPNARRIPDGPVELEFEGVSFRYPSASEVSLASLESVPTLEKNSESEVLHDIGFRVAPGELVALVGPSGAGKTTLVQLAARLYDATRGAVKINGVDVREATAKSLRDAVGMVMQDPHMFHDTIAVNLRYAKPGASDAELEEALAAAQLTGLMKALPKGLETVVGERGYRLSGGERQRLAIARLLLKAPRLVILDEATAHLDSTAEGAIQQAFSEALVGRTSLVIAHRLSTVQMADQILVLQHGRIVERGRHDELVRAGNLYAELYLKQFKERRVDAVTA